MCAMPNSSKRGTAPDPGSEPPPRWTASGWRAWTSVLGRGEAERLWLLLLAAPLLAMVLGLWLGVWRGAASDDPGEVAASAVGPLLVVREVDAGKGGGADLTFQEIEAGKGGGADLALQDIDAPGIVRFARRDLSLLPAESAAGFGTELLRDFDRGGNARWRIAEPLAAEAEPLRLRLGDVALAGEQDGQLVFNAVVFDPTARFVDLGPLPEPLVEAVEALRERAAALGMYGATRLPNGTGEWGEARMVPVQAQMQAPEPPAAPPFATHPAIVRGAAMVALLKADRHGAERIAFVQPWADGPLPPLALPLPAVVWADAIRRAAREVAVHLHHIERVELFVDPRANVSGEPGALAGTLQRLTSSSRLENLAMTFERSFAMALPWTRAGETFVPTSVARDLPLFDSAPDDVSAAGRLVPAQLNPALNGHGRVTSVPLWIGLAGYALAFAWLFRRRAPLRFQRTPGLLIGLPVAGVFVGLLSVGANLSRGWVDGLDWPLATGAQSALLLLGGSVAAGALGLAAGTAAFVAATRRVAPEGEAPVGNAEGEATESAAAVTVRRYLHSDNPVRHPSEDRLGFSNLVNALADFLDNRGTKPPVVIAINGPWGSGKSSVMRMLASVLNDRQRFRIAWFNAWQYQQEEQLLAAFLKTVASELSRHWGVLFGLRLGWVRLKHASFGQLFMVVVPVGLLAFGLFDPETVEAWMRYLGGGVFTGEEAAVSSGRGRYAQLVALVGGGAGLAALARFVYPFRLHYRRLFAVRDVSQRIGFLDEFQQEFRFYREAVGREKFLIVVDDLDRCHPEAVVEVLKTINLIVNSDAGPGKTFFILGFDADYIEHSVQYAFQEFAEAQGEGGDSRAFGRQYLKKIVTVGVSVPVPDPERLRELTAVLGSGATPEKRLDAPPPSAWQRLGYLVAGLLESLRRPLPLVVLFLVALLVFAIVQRPDPPPPAVPASETSPREMPAVVEDGPPAAMSPEDGEIVSLAPASATPTRTPVDWLLLPAEALALVGLLSAALGVIWSAARHLRAPPEPSDPAAFGEAIIELADYLPSNPRDLVRLINRVRLDFLLQADTQDSLDARDSVALTLLREAHPAVLDAPELAEHYLPALAATGACEPALEAIETDAAAWVAATRRALQALPPAADVFGNATALRHFLRVHGRLV